MYSEDRLDEAKPVSQSGFSIEEYAHKLGAPQLVRALREAAVEEAELLGDEAPSLTLQVDDSIYEDSTHEPVSHDPGYIRWLRLVCLRVLVLTPALGQLNGLFGFNLVNLTRFLGLTNLEVFVRVHTLGEVHQALEEVLDMWESEHGVEPQFPASLNHNLDSVCALVGLTSVERNILGLAILVHVEPAMDAVVGVLGEGLYGYAAPRVLAPMLRVKSGEVVRALSRESKLYTTGLLSIDMTGRFSLRHLIDLLTSSFAAQMLIRHDDIRRLVEGFVQPVLGTTLTPDDFRHVATDRQICSALLTRAMEDQTPGINILLHGKPGTGKTEFVRMLAADLNVQLMEISPHNLAGHPVTPLRRVRSFLIAQDFFCNQPTLLLFDECAEVLQQGPGSTGEEDEAKVPRKSWINRMLERNVIPTVWITNSIAGYDEAYLRRFSVCLEMPAPSEEHRLAMLERAFSGVIGPAARLKISKSRDISPALIESTAHVVKTLASHQTQLEHESVAIHLINSRLKIQGKVPLSLQAQGGFGPDDFQQQWINADADLEGLRRGLQDGGSGRLCLYGPPGTGKTAIGQWLAHTLNLEHTVIKASTLISPFPGETERNIAQAFSAAREHGALLQLDEVDSFLQERQKAFHQWEVTQVNEMLTQMEGFEGIFIASTNLFESLDEASLRRFDMAIKVDFMKPTAAWEMFLKTCEKLGLDDVEASLQARVGRMRCLTPGDFEQLRRRSKLQPVGSAAALVRSLEAAVGLKKGASKGVMGFSNNV